MLPHSLKKKTRLVVDRVLPDLVRNLMDEKSWPEGHPGELYTRALDALVESLLGGLSSTFGHLHLGTELGNPDPQEVGLLYQSLRSFRLQFGKGHHPAIVPCARSRRNQGLFYTPPEVVSFIVEQTLDAAPVKHPEDYLDFRILDPAVGTAVFLAEALGRITGRVLSPGDPNSMSPRKRISDIREALNERGRLFGVTLCLDNRAAVAIHVLEECLFGVDVDPVALKIAEAVLLEKVGTESRLLHGFVTTNLREGNALVGQGHGDPSTISREGADRSHACMGLLRPTAVLEDCGRESERSLANNSPQPLFAKGGKGGRGGISRGGDHTTSGKFGSDARETISRWCAKNRVFHWPLEFPGVFSRERPGFDAVLGNPPYEIVSVKESGVEDRRDQQRYYRRAYRTCKGKINTYRLMLERGLALLRTGGALGFIVPSTLLADSTAALLRRAILNGSEIRSAVVIPEKARVFEGVTQALLIIVTRKGGSTVTLKPAFWDGRGPIAREPGIEVPLEVIEKTDLRIPLLRSEEEKALLQSLTRHPQFRGNQDWPPAGKVHQGEINLTVHSKFITSEPTGHPLVRGEHVFPLRVAHPSARPGRLDWVRPEFLNNVADMSRPQTELFPHRNAERDARGRPWEQNRIVLGRVVNMGTQRRLKAAHVPAGTFLGDMTNYITDLSVPEEYLLGVLNSSLLNWRLKLTSTNNYLSAAEIEALAIPRPPRFSDDPSGRQWACDHLPALCNDQCVAVPSCVERLDQLLANQSDSRKQVLLACMIHELLRSSPVDIARDESVSGAFWAVLDAVVIRIYGVEGLAERVVFR